MSSSSLLTRISDLDASKLIFSKSGYTYGPSAKIVYVDYETPRKRLNVMLGPFSTPFGLSAYDNNMSKLSITLNVPHGSTTMQAMDVLDESLREGILQKHLLPAWTPHTPNADYVRNCYVPVLNESQYGGQMRIGVRLVPDDMSKVKPLVLSKEWADPDDHSKGYITKVIHYSSLEELCEIIHPQSRVHVTAQLNGIVFSRSDIRLKWEAAHIIKDNTYSPSDDIDQHSSSVFCTLPDISFLE